ncbi:MAG TPA: heme biosynthesis protein HemY, partial [Burkholderiales bacterium]|nr:heme biosynthesis protein HemY [Burkholderiales bacterium]
REIIEHALAAEWGSRLVALYAQLPASLPLAEREEEARLRIERAEHWLAEHNRDPELLAALGRLCVQAELWGKARSFLEASLSFEATRPVHVDLARLAERLGDTGEAQRHFRRAAELP